MERGKKAFAEKQGEARGSDVERRRDALSEGGIEGREDEARGDGSTSRRVGGGPKRRGGETDPRGEELRAERGKEGKRKAGEQQATGEKPNKRKETENRKPAKGKTLQVYVRLSEAMDKAVSKAIEQSPIEFEDRSEFIRRAVENELRRRGLLPNFK